MGHCFIFVFYSLIALAGYFYLGDELLLFDYKNIIFSYGISFFVKFVLNFLTICIVITHMCIKFRTLKQKATILIRNENRDSNIWHVFIITLLHIIQVVISCILSAYVKHLEEIFLLTTSGYTILICYSIPFFLFYKIFQNSNKHNAKRFLFVFMFCVANFFYVAINYNIISQFFYDFDI